MALFLEVLEGSEAGQRFHISAGTRLGRAVGEILIKDPKVSSLHAQVEKDEKNQLILIDAGSSNGLRVNGRRVQKVALLPGVKFQVGKTLFRVVQLFEDEFEERTPTRPRSWKEVLLEQVPRIIGQNKTGAKTVTPFKPLLQLRFLEGIQAESEFTLGYGHRQFGSDVLDLELQDPEAPGLAFELAADDIGILFSTPHPDIVRLNDSPKDSEYIHEGDKIRIGQSLIEIRFLK